MSTVPPLRVLPALLLAAPALLGAQVLRDPALPYASWGEAQREAADAIGGRPLVRPAGNRYRVGDAVIVDDENGKVYRAHVIAAENTRYRVRYDGFGPENVRFYDAARVLGYQPGFAGARAVPAPASPAPPAPPAPAASAPVGPGTWGCVESTWRIKQATYEFEPRGTFTLAADGTYDYPGLGTRGRWRWDAATSAVRFAGGAFDGARAARIEDSPKLRLELPTQDPQRPRRWTCGPV